MESFPPITEMTAQQLMYAADNVQKLAILQKIVRTSLKLGSLKRKIFLVQLHRIKLIQSKE